MAYLISIYTTSGELSAHVIKSQLESAGIPVILQYQGTGLIYGSNPVLGGVKILVPLELAEKARQIIKPQE